MKVSALIPTQSGNLHNITIAYTALVFILLFISDLQDITLLVHAYN